MEYKKAGVDIDAGNNFVEIIKPLVKSTHRDGVVGSIGGFGGLFDVKGYKNPLLVAATDGVGTKLKIAQIVGKHNSIGIDLVAMCVNDIIVQGAEPLFFLDYFSSGKLEIETATAVVAGIAEGCKQAGCALIGGETAEMPDMYGKGDYDLAGFCVGAVEKKDILPQINDIKEGDIMLGLASSGVHSNGFSLVRYIMEKSKLDYSSQAPFDTGKTLGETFLEPTKIYVKSCLKVAKKVKAFSHITGGGLLENIPRILPSNLKPKFNNIEMPEIFKWLQKEGDISEKEMQTVFNCGIGMVAIVSPKNKEEIKSILEQEGEQIFEIGTISL